MEIKTLSVVQITPSTNGNFLTQREAEDGERIFSDCIYLSPKDSESRYKEVTPEERAEIENIMNKNRGSVDLNE